MYLQLKGGLLTMNEIFLKTSSFIQLGAPLHGIIRYLIFKEGFEVAYSHIALELYSLFIRSKYTKKKSLKLKNVRKLALYLYELDEAEDITSSCVSIAVAIQAILFANGINSHLVIGVRKADEKLFSHAWVCLENEIIDPREKYRGLVILQKLTLVDEIEKWVSKES